MKTIAVSLAVVFIAVTLLPAIRKHAWWIRLWDFPRAQIAVFGVVVLGLYLLVWNPAQAIDRAVFIAIIYSLIWQIVCIYPYTPFARRQVRKAKIGSGGPRLSLLIANVLMENRNSGKLLRLIQNADPDVVLAVETDLWWRSQFTALNEIYPHAVAQPLNNTYGITLLSRLELIDPEVRFLVEADIPSIHTGIRLTDGTVVELHALHPKPPAPQETLDTSGRDAELLLVGREIAQRKAPAIVAGDFNDVAWSYTTTLFQKVSGLLDPRIGRGLYSSFSAKTAFLRFPVDHVFHSDHFKLVELQRLPAFGSDHFPIVVRLALESGARTEQQEPAATPADMRQADEMIDEVRQREEL